MLRKQGLMKKRAKVRMRCLKIILYLNINLDKWWSKMCFIITVILPLSYIAIFKYLNQFIWPHSVCCRSFEWWQSEELRWKWPAWVSRTGWPSDTGRQHFWLSCAGGCSRSLPLIGSLAWCRQTNVMSSPLTTDKRQFEIITEHKAFKFVISICI